MNGWVLRATALGALVVVLRAALGFAMVYWPTQGSWMRPLCLVVLVAAIVFWGVLDGRKDRQVHPDPEHGSDLTIRWLKTAIGAGLGSGAISWLLDFLPKFDLGDNGLLFELTASASFIVLLVFIPGLIGVGIGRIIADRRITKSANPPVAQQPEAAATPV
ncbi:B-4DMT family transporter [Nocardia sp. NBC_00565]|uniref:B-4DMT family transporter n=1 Tax=Nocardia sp. NBC_00565 TaxID=2975993 RepID=UPI002E808F34|nr:B-4DMT family transporter [Nocardia sp. NBC_00565]WUC07157.1 B-4DMT family transporter [Nocardia sp. NBC_00565]